MSRKYQGLIVLNTKSLDGTIDALVSSITKEFEAEGAKLEKINQLGRREFAYNARDLESGHYVEYHFTSCPQALNKIQARLKLNDHVFLQHYQRA